MNIQAEKLSRIYLLVAGLFFPAALLTHLGMGILRAEHWLALSLESLILVMYGLCVILCLWRRPQHPAVNVFFWIGFLVSLTVVFPPLDFWLRPNWLFHLSVACYTLIYFLNFAVVIHMAALVPHRHPWITRHPWLIHLLYTLGGLLTITVYVFLLSCVGEFRAGCLEGFLTVRQILMILYLFAGLCGLILLGTAAHLNRSRAERNQALLVFLGLIPWNIQLILRLTVPDLYQSFPGYFLLEPMAILLIPCCFFIAIFGFNLFGTGFFFRKSLIYGFSLLLLGIALVAVWSGAGMVTSSLIGFQPSFWNTALVLVLLGIAARPVLRRVTEGVDRAFFPEKIALRRLQRTLIPGLANYTRLDELARHLVESFHDSLSMSVTTLLVMDENAPFLRRRAEAGLPADARETGLPREELERLWPDPVRRPLLYPTVDHRMAALSGWVRDTLRTFQARVLVPIVFRENWIALLILGAPPAAVAFSRDDLNCLEVLAQQASAMMENARLYDLATHDQLTGLPRRRFLLEQLAAELERSRRTARTFAVCLLDLDDFKQVNDQHGHLAGDQALRGVAGVLRDSLRQIDGAARFGGEEFAVLLRETDEDGARASAEKIRTAVAAAAVRYQDAPPFHLTVSIGLYIFRMTDADLTPTDILERADQALYRAKAAGKNRVVVWIPV
ncbi:MAG: sensor domain-containing diguanylate cyclase [Acidobacteria bacterium]|nr:sensor domain-containing diguanylate cyclase [Acidobacteriota bacterium]